MKAILPSFLTLVAFSFSPFTVVKPKPSPLAASKLVIPNVAFGFNTMKVAAFKLSAVTPPSLANFKPAALATTKHSPETSVSPNSNVELTVEASIANICSPNGFTSASEAAFGNLKEKPLPERLLFKSLEVVPFLAISIFATFAAVAIS